MEPPPGPCSSPPGPRPVPPPRRGSMERRPLSPLKRGGERPGAWEAAGDGGARGGKAGTPERATVTQRVLIVMQGQESAPITSPPRSPPETAPKSWAPPPRSPPKSWAPPPETAPKSSAPPPETTPKSSAPPPETTPQSWAPPPETTPKSWASPPETTPKSWVPPPEMTPKPWVPPPETTPKSWAPPPETTLKSWVPPPRSPLRLWAPPPETAPRSGAPPQVQNQGTPQGEPPSGAQGHSNIQSTPKKNLVIGSGRPPSHATVQERAVSPSHSVPIHNQLVSPPHDTRGTPPRAEEVGPSSGAPSHCTEVQDCTTTHDSPLSLQGDSTRVKEDSATHSVRQSGYTVTDGDMNRAPALLPEDVTSAPALPPEDVTITLSLKQKDVTSASGLPPEDIKIAPALPPKDVASAVTVRPEDTKIAPSVRPEDVTSTPAVIPNNVKSAPAIQPEDVTSAPVVRPEDVTSAPAVRPEDVTSAPAVRPEDVTSAPAIRPEDVTSAPAVRPEDVTSAPTVRPEDVTSAPSVRPEDMKSASAIRPEDVTSAPAIRPEDMKSAPAVRPEDLITQQEAHEKQDGGPVMSNVTQTQVNPTTQMSNPPAQPSLGLSSQSPVRVPDPSSPHRNISSKPPLPIPSRSNLYPGHPPREQETSTSHETASLSSFKSKAPAPDTLSYLDSVSLMSGTMESLTLLDDASSLGSDSEINGMPYRKTDKYGFLGGNQFSGIGESAIPVEIARQRELKWLEMFNNWDKWLTRRFQKVKLRCRKGIPSSLRAKAWQFLSNSHELLTKNPGKFEEMERQPGDPKWLDVIEKDLHRQFPFHEMFAARGGHGQQDLYRILKAYTVYRPEEGYCQAQAPVAAVLLMHMPAEQAFWCLVQICDKYLPGYYSAGLEAIQLDGEIFFALLRRVCPMAYRHLKKFKIDPILYMTEWFMCVFSRTLPWACVLRVWDMFFCEGVKIVFRVGLVLLKHALGSVDKLRSCQGMYETMEKLRSLPPHCMQEEVLLPEVSSLPVTDALIERESNTQLRKWRENRGELQYRPSRRLHGAKQVYEEKLRLNPTLSGSRLSLSSLRRPSPPTTPALTVQPESVVVSEGLRPALPSPTSNKAPLGPPREAPKKGKEKQREQERKREREEREREKKREKEEREERRKEKEREKQKEKEEKRIQKEREKAETRPKKERKFSFRRKESSSTADSPRTSGPGATDSAAAHDTYF